ncbi:MAG: energy-coupled thiamine transporter ThiT [Lachnospiraceae bacterium]|nr:energy-coupled thiamine transporter ThiT [Lachnospiraceae bacterium]
MSFFIGTTADGDKFLTTAGYTALILLAIALLLIGNALLSKRKTFDTTRLAFAAMALALGVVTSFIKVYHMPMGGSITLFSMLFISVIGYWFGLGAGLTTAFAYGLLQLMIDPYILSIPQMLIDYIFAFGALGLSGCFTKCKSKYAIIFAYLTAITGRFFFSVLSGYVFFAEWAPEGWNPIVYSMAYNAAYIYAEGAITVIVLLIPAVRTAFNHVKAMALKEQ